MYFSEDSSTTTDIDAENADTNAEYAPSASLEPRFPTKKELDDLIRDLGLTKSGAELLTFRLNEWNLLGDDCKNTATEIGTWSFLFILMLLKTFAITKIWKACLALLE